MATTWQLVKKLLFRLDGAADSAKTEFVSALGNRWSAEFALHSGTDPQAPRLMVMFRSLSDPAAPQRYTLAPPHVSKVPEEAIAQMDEAALRALLAASAEM